MNIFLLITILSGILLIYLILRDAVEKKDHSYYENSNVKSVEDDNQYKNIVFSRCLLTENEKFHYKRLVELLPSSVMVHTQISFNSFLKCEHIDVRNRYNRAVVDVVVTDLDFNVLVLIEIDDSSHLAKKVKAKDKVRDEITSGAGIATLRINDKTTDAEILRKIKKHLPKNKRKSYFVASSKVINKKVA